MAVFLQRIEAQYGKAGRVWLMDRYLVGTPKGRLSKHEKDLLDWATGERQEWADSDRLAERGKRAGKRAY